MPVCNFRLNTVITQLHTPWILTIMFSGEAVIVLVRMCWQDAKCDPWQVGAPRWELFRWNRIQCFEEKSYAITKRDEIPTSHWPLVVTVLDAALKLVCYVIAGEQLKNLNLLASLKGAA